MTTITDNDLDWMRLVAEIRAKTGWTLDQCEQAATTLRRDLGQTKEEEG